MAKENKTDKPKDSGQDMDKFNALGSDANMATPSPADKTQVFPQALMRTDFKQRPELTWDFVRGCEPWLGDADFHDKAASIWPQGAWLAMRAHPAALWADLAQLDPALLPGGAGVCLGDAHFDNFGFIQLPGQPDYFFGPNDLDDGGVGPVALDALKYFAVLADQPRLQGYLDILLQRYVSALRDPGLERRVPKHLGQDPAVVFKKKLDKYVASGKIRPEALPFKTAPLSEQTRADLQQVLLTAPQLRGCVLLDAVDQYKLAGGSYGGERHWVLVTRPGTGLDLIEFKLMTVPAASVGPFSRPMTQGQRIQFLKQALWHTPSEADYFVVPLAGRDFLVRSRLHKATLAPLELTSPEDVDSVLEAQVSILAALHRPSLVGIASDRLAYWLHASAQVLLARWQTLISASQALLAPPTS